jgi:YfiR/HmsC-like
MRLRKIIFFGLSLGLLLAAELGRAQTPPRPTEYQLKAAFLYNFAKFIDWPPEALADEKEPFIIGVLGDNPFGNDLEQTVAAKKINDHTISIQSFHTAAEAAHCQILFISKSEEKHFSEIIQALHGTAVLTVSENDGFIKTGGMVNFVKEDNKIRFQINDEAAKANRLKISSKLLSLAVASSR